MTNEEGWAVYRDRLREAYDQAGRPTVRSIAERSGLSTSTVHNITSGAHTPHRPNLVAVLDGIRASPRQTEVVLLAYDAARTRSNPGIARRDRVDAVRSGHDAIAQAIREGLADIADAIRSLGKAP